jgi:hypothetical protein
VVVASLKKKAAVVVVAAATAAAAAGKPARFRVQRSASQGLARAFSPGSGEGACLLGSPRRRRQRLTSRCVVRS